jgi:hypothetical protein
MPDSQGQEEPWPQSGVLEYARQVSATMRNAWLPVLHSTGNQDYAWQRCFALPGWDATKQRLDYKHFQLTGVRHTLCLDGERVRVSWCSCSTEQREQQQVFMGADFVRSSRQEVEEAARGCLHLEVLEVGRLMATVVSSFPGSGVWEVCLSSGPTWNAMHSMHAAATALS